MKLALVLLALILLLVVWGGDRVSFEGERTVYTVRCDGGTFQGKTCSGKLAAAERYRFRALRNRHEVLFWVVDTDEPSGKYTDCTIRDRGNWSCKVAAPHAPTITYQMVKNVPQRGTEPPTKPFHAVRKWKWWLMKMNVRLFRNADL